MSIGRLYRGDTYLWWFCQWKTLCVIRATFGAPCKALSISNIAIFKVAKIPTLKTSKVVINSDLHAVSCVPNIGNLFSGLYKRNSTVRRIRHHQMPGRSWRAGKAIAAMESPKALIAPLKRGSGGLKASDFTISSGRFANPATFGAKAANCLTASEATSSPSAAPAPTEA
mgnify:CR=1 FL=1